MAQNKLLNEIISRRNINREFSKSLTDVKKIKKGLKKKIKYHQRDKEDFEKEVKAEFARLNAKISKLEEENKEIKVFYGDELNKSYIEWAHTYKTLSNEADYGAYSELRSDSQTWLSLAMERHKSQHLLFYGSMVLENALSEDPRAYQKKDFK